MNLFGAPIEVKEMCNIRGKLDERYLILNKLEKGSFSKVRVCIDTQTNQRYAIKIFNEEFAKNPKNMDMIAQEINTHVKFDNENIAKLVNYNFSGKLRKTDNRTKVIKYLILELGDRGALFELLSSKKRFPVKIARHFFKQMMNGLVTLHKNNIGHRDIKLENFIVDKNFNVKLIDFGFCCEVKNAKNEHITHSKILGTESYMAPEMLYERKYFADKFDVFSIGVVLFGMIVGHLPFMKAARYDSSYCSFAFKREAGIKKFWENINKTCEIPTDAIDLLNKIFTANPNERITIDNIVKSEFYNGETESLEELNRFFNTF